MLHHLRGFRPQEKDLRCERGKESFQKRPHPFVPEAHDDPVRMAERVDGLTYPEIFRGTRKAELRELPFQCRARPHGKLGGDNNRRPGA